MNTENDDEKNKDDENQAVEEEHNENEQQEEQQNENVSVHHEPIHVLHKSSSSVSATRPASALRPGRRAHDRSSMPLPNANVIRFAKDTSFFEEEDDAENVNEIPHLLAGGTAAGGDFTTYGEQSTQNARNSNRFPQRQESSASIDTADIDSEFLNDRVNTFVRYIAAGATPAPTHNGTTTSLDGESSYLSAFSQSTIFGLQSYSVPPQFQVLIDERQTHTHVCRSNEWNYIAFPMPSARFARYWENVLGGNAGLIVDKGKEGSFTRMLRKSRIMRREKTYILLNFNVAVILASYILYGFIDSLVVAVLRDIYFQKQESGTDTIMIEVILNGILPTFASLPIGYYADRIRKDEVMDFASYYFLTGSSVLLVALSVNFIFTFDQEKNISDLDSISDQWAIWAVIMFWVCGSAFFSTVLLALFTDSTPISSRSWYTSLLFINSRFVSFVGALITLCVNRHRDDEDWNRSDAEFVLMAALVVMIVVSFPLRKVDDDKVRRISSNNLNS